MEEKRMSPAATADSPSPAVDPPASRRRGGALKRKAANFSGGNTSTPPTASSSKRQAREKPSPVLFPPIHNGPCTRARQQPNNLFPGSETTGFWDAVVKSEAVPPEFAGGGTLKVEEELGAGKEDWEALVGKIEAEYEVVKSRDVNAHIVPNHAGWFSWSRVHPLEEQTLPSFFNGKSEKRTPEIYMEIRNSIMNKFHSNPNMLIEVKDLSELSVGELDARQEVMEFLDYWGLINYHPLPETNTTSLTIDGDKVEKADSLIHMLYHFEAEQSISPPALRTNISTATVPSRLLPESVIADELARPEGTGVDYHCNSCSADCSRKRYHCQKQADFDLCSECFNGRKFDSGMSPSDFILMEPAEAAGASGGKWTDQETLLLLEALELFSENWNEIAEHVATKTKAQCILHFIQMPIEDTFLDCDDEIDSSVKENNDAVATNNDNLPPEDAPEMTENKDEATDDRPLSAQIEISNPVEPSEPKVDQEKGSENSAVNALKEAFKTVGTLPSSAEKLSFADSGNPVMALAAFLVRLVEPNVAIASSRSSLKFISSNESSMQLAARHSFLLEDPTDDKSSTETERDVTETDEPEGEKAMDEMQKEEKSGRESDDTDSSKDHDKRTDKDLNTEENELLVASKKNKALVMEELGLSDSPEKDKNMDTEEKDPSISPENAKDAIPEEKEQLTSFNVECTEKSFSAIKSDLMDTDQMVESSLPSESNSLELQKEKISSIAEKDNEPSQLLGDNQSTEGPKDEEIVSDSLPKEKTEMLQPHTPTSLVGNGGNSAGEAITREHKQENKVPLNTKDDKSIYNMKRAAVTAISAAAVKAKLLADQEEDQIRQLATSLIEKQLHKLETKLAFFSEMDNVVSRVREQLERSKQKLYHERAQIIAARLGISAASSRPTAPQSLPNRAAMTFPNAIARPPMSLTPQRPPISRPMMPPGTPSSNPTAPATVTASNQDNPSSVGMK